MLPEPKLRPAVFPTDRLNSRGLATQPLRNELRNINDLRNAFTVVFAWVQTLGMLIGSAVIVNQTGWWPVWILSYLLMARGHALFGILGHETAHRLLFSKTTTNDRVGKWLLNCPTLVSQEAYRRSHMAHHRDALGANEPDKTLYANYPITSSSMKRKLRRDMFGESGVKLLRGLLRALRNPTARRSVTEILCVQMILAVVLGFTVAWWAWPVLWLAPWMTVWRVINRLRAIAEHGGMTNDNDERLVTHHVRQSRSARFWMVPYNTGWHIAHHLDAGVPWRNLPRFHKELVDAGYIVDELVYTNYRSLWKRLSSRNL
jgi:fatty acid desaturase